MIMFNLNHANNISNGNNYNGRNNFNVDSKKWQEDFTTLIFELNGGHKFSVFDTEFSHNDHVATLYWYDKYDKEIQSGPFSHLISSSSSSASQKEDNILQNSINKTKILRQLNDYTANITGLFVDPYGHNLYYSNEFINVIGVMKTDGNFHKVLFQRELDISKMVMSPKLGIIAWIEEIYNPFLPNYKQILMANADGTNIHLISKVYGHVHDIAIDENAGTLYWLSAEGINFTKIHEEPHITEGYLNDDRYINYPLGFAFDEHHMFWDSDFKEEKNLIYVAPFPQKGFSPKIFTSNTAIWGPYVNLRIGYLNADAEQSKDLEETKLVCDECQQLCLPVAFEENKNWGSKRVCSCGDGYKLDSDLKTCYTIKPKDNFLVVADGQLQDIILIHYENPEFFVPLPINVSERPVTVKYDELTGMLIWSDIGHNNFQYFSILDYIDLTKENHMVNAAHNGNDQGSDHVNYKQDSSIKPKVLRAQRSNESLSDCMAIDPIRRLLYYTDVGRQQLSVYDIEGAYHKTLIRGLSKPRALVVDRPGGFIFWSEWGHPKSRISRATMAGTEIKILVEEDNLVYYPNGLVYDERAERLYWIDAKLQALFSCDIDGGQKSRMASISRHPFGLALSSDGYIYWSNWMTDTIKKKHIKEDIPSIPGNDKDFTSPSFGRLLDIALHEQKVWLETIGQVRKITKFDPETRLIDGCFVQPFNDSWLGDEMWMNNGGCSQFCFPLPGKKHICGCRDGESLHKDGVTCLVEGRTSPRNNGRKNMNRYLVDNMAKESVIDYPESIGGIESVECNHTDLMPKPNVVVNSYEYYDDKTSEQEDGSYRKVRVNHKCNTSHVKISGDEERYCFVSSNLTMAYWIGKALECQAITCPALELTTNSEIVWCSSSKVNGYCYLRCKDGYTYGSGSAFITCLPAGKWSGTQFICDKIGEAPDVPSIPIAADVPSIPPSHTTDSAVTTQHEPGKCELPNFNENHIMSPSHEECHSKHQKVSSGTKCAFECIKSSNYTFIVYERESGSSPGQIIECTKDGVWSTHPLVCKLDILCNKHKFSPPNLDWGYENVSCTAGNFLDSECEMRCTEGKNLISGSLKRKCLSHVPRKNLLELANHEDISALYPYWSGEPPFCSKCSLPNLFNEETEGIIVDCVPSASSSLTPKIEDSDYQNRSNWLNMTNLESVCTAKCKPSWFINVITDPEYPTNQSFACQGEQKTNITSKDTSAVVDNANHTDDALLRWILFESDHELVDKANEKDYDSLGFPICGAVTIPDHVEQNLSFTVSAINKANEETVSIKCKDIRKEIEKWIYSELLRIPESEISNECSFLTIFGAHEISNCPWLLKLNLCKHDHDTVIEFTSPNHTAHLPATFQLVSQVNNVSDDNELKKNNLLFWREKMRFNLRKINHYLPYEMVLGDQKYRLERFTHNEVQNFHNAMIKCSNDSILFDNSTCVQCPKGTKTDTQANECVLCDIGFYQSEPGKNDCIKCPEGLTTKHRGAGYKSTCINMNEKRKPKRSTFVVLLISFIILMAIILVAAYFLLRDRGFGFRRSAHALYPISSIFQRNRTEAREMAHVPYGSFA